MTPTATTWRRGAIIAALVAVAAIAVPGASAAGCAVAKHANCAGQDMRHLGSTMKGKNMAGADLSGADMRGMNLTGMNLSGANLSGAKLDGSKLMHATMVGADMHGTTIKNVKMTGAKMMKADLTGATIIGGNWSKVDFGKATMDGITVSKTNMSHADFTGVKAGKRADATRQVRGLQPGSPYGLFAGVNLNYAHWANADMHNASFVNGTSFAWAEMENSDFSSTLFFNTPNVEIFGMRDSNLTSARFMGATWLPAFATRMVLDNVTCWTPGQPANRTIFGAVHSVNFNFVGQTANGYTAQSNPWNYSYHPPTYDWLWTYALRTADGGSIGSQGNPTATSANNSPTCQIVGVNGAL